MASEVLVERRIEDGLQLLGTLQGRGFDVAAAAWLQSTDDEQEYLYIVSNAIQPGHWSDAYRGVMEAMLAGGEYGFSYDQVRLAQLDEPIGQALVAARESLARAGVQVACGIVLPSLTSLGFSSVLMYPPAGRMTVQQVARTVARLLETEPTNGRGAVGSIRRGQNVLRVRPTGLRREASSGRLVVDTLDPATNQTETIPADEITDIRFQ